MKNTSIKTCGLIALTIACLSAPLALVALGGTFRMAARMANRDVPGPVVSSEARVPVTAVAFVSVAP